MTLAFKHSAGGFGNLDTLTWDEERGVGPISLHNAITNEAPANRPFEQISEIEQALVERCVQLLDQAGTIKDLTNDHWWPRAEGCSGTI